VAFDIPNSCAISCLTAAAVMTFPLAGVSAVLGRPLFTIAFGNTSSSSQRRFSGLRNTLEYDYYKCRWLRAFRSKRRLPIRWSFEQNWALPCTVCPRVHLTTRYVILTNNTVVKILSRFDGNTYAEKSRSLDVCFIHVNFHLLFNNGWHCV